MAKRRVIMRIEILPEACQRLDQAIQSFGMPNVVMSSRLMKWLITQPETIQASILGLYPDFARPEILSLILEEMTQDLA
jgi:hypothetical protein